MMKDQLSTRDYEYISAYIDNQLSDKDRAHFEARLKAEPELQKELHEISTTRIMIHTLTKLRAPRNYYIKSIPAPVKSTLRLAPVFGIVSAVASVLLALVIFGNTFLKSNQPVALAPAAAPVIMETQTVQQEAPRSIAPLAPTSEAPPVLVMQAPKLEASPTENIFSIEISQQTTVATPTTIYLFAYPPTATPQNIVSMNELQSETSVSQCEKYYGSGAYPTLTTQYDCPTPTPSFTPTQTPTPTSAQAIEGFLGLYTPTSTASPSETPTVTETPTATPTETPTVTPTPTPTLSPSPVSSPTELPPAIGKTAPTTAAQAPSELTAPNADSGFSIANTATQEQTVSPSTGSDVSFVNYLLLTVEISLASIAVIAGVIAIILRIRAGR